MLNMLATPQCSVILPTYNRAATLPRAVASVLAQDGADFELIVVDDASTDATADWLNRHSHERMRVLRAERQSGPSAARNLGLAAARADVTAFLDSDDAYLPDRLAVPLRILAAEPDVVCTLSSSERDDKKRTRIASQPDLKLNADAFRWALMCRLIGVESSSLTVRTAAARTAGGFRDGLSHDEDGEFLMRLAGLGAARLLPDVLWKKFWSADALSHSSRADGPGLLDYFAAQPDFVDRFRKLGSYRASRVLVTDLRRWDVAALVADWRRFRATGVLAANPLQAWRDHHEVSEYRKHMRNAAALAALQGPPESWR